jgi:hypothetical protein
MNGKGINIIGYSPEMEAEIIRELGFIMPEADDIIETSDLGLTDVPMREVTSVMPESPDILEEQLRQVAEGKRKAMLVTNGAELPVLPSPDITLIRVPQGYLYININKISPERAAQLAMTNRLGLLLGDGKKGYGIAGRPDESLGMVVTLRNRDGLPTDDVEADPKSLTSVLDALSSLNDGTGSIEIRNAMDALKERNMRNMRNMR